MSGVCYVFICLVNNTVLNVSVTFFPHWRRLDDDNIINRRHVTLICSLHAVRFHLQMSLWVNINHLSSDVETLSVCYCQNKTEETRASHIPSGGHYGQYLSSNCACASLISKAADRRRTFERTCALQRILLWYGQRKPLLYRERIAGGSWVRRLYSTSCFNYF